MHSNSAPPLVPFLLSFCACGVYDIESRFEGDSSGRTESGSSTAPLTTGASGDDTKGEGSTSTSGAASATTTSGAATQWTTSETTSPTDTTGGSSGEESFGDTVSGDTTGQDATTSGEQDLWSAEEIYCAGASRDSLGSWVFVSDDVFTGELSHEWSADINSGARRGDVYCQCAARKAGLAGGYVAWLSTKDQSMADFLAQAKDTPRHFIRHDAAGGCVASDWGSLISNKHLLPINRTQSGEEIFDTWDTPTHWVWTGTRPNGDATDLGCGGWSTDADSKFGKAGEATMTDGGWTNSIPPIPCSLASRLYCIQIAQEPAKDYAAYCPDAFTD